ncbi:MAG: MBL fold metallo-hydrolase [Acidimicrobiia bacterium]|nr:MBL fold metallo-hydrolase [Acidimicrobiia bacterium]
MLLESRSAPPFFENGFVVACERTREAVIIDPGDQVDELIAEVDHLGLTVRHILLTHAHIDHVTGVPAAKQVFGVDVHLHQDDLFLYQMAPQQGAMFGVAVGALPQIDAFYEGGEIRFGDHQVHVHHTPGHCPGGVCLQIADRAGGEHLFVGDTLFAGSIGRTDLPGGDYETLMRSITRVLFPLGDGAIVHPGHGPDTTIGRERKTNPFLVEYLRTRGRS